MKRRTFLATSTGLTSGIAGCFDLEGNRLSDPAASSTASGTRTKDAPGNATRLARQGHPSSICNRPILYDFSIRSIVDPAVADGWTGAEVPHEYGRGEGELLRGLGADARVIGVARDGSARAYPLSIVAEHEIVNDDFGGPLLATYCPRCQSGMTAERRVNGARTTFHVSGNLWKISGSDDNLVMYDAATESYWGQIVATAICGPEAGTELSLVPSEFTTWSDWVATHPETTVLLPPPASRVAPV